MENPWDQGEKGFKSLAREDPSTALTLLVKTFKKRVFHHIYSITRDYEASLDLVQETFIRALKEERIFDNDFKVLAWLFRVSSNLSFNYMRSLKRRERVQKEPFEGTCRVEAPFLMERREDMERVRAALDRLPSRLKEVLVLRYYDELSYEEIGVVQKIRIGTVMSRLFRAKERLLKEFMKIEGEGGGRS